MRINEAYEHEPIRSYQPENSCPLNGCSKIGTQCVDIAASVTLTPTASVGAVTVACQGTPTVTCQTNGDASSCLLTITQEVCVSVPVTYGVTLTNGDATIACTDNNCIGCGCC